MCELTKNSIHAVTIDGCTSDGDGVARIDGRVVFVRGGIPGEKCEARILKCGKSAAWAKIERLTEPSAHRITPSCPVFGKCGGCDFLHMDYEEELRIKKRRVEDALLRIGGTDIGVERIIGAAKLERYRNKAIYTVTDVGGAPEAGFYRERSHDVVSAGGCLIQSDTADRAVGAICRWMRERRVPAYDEATGRGCIRRVFCRTAVNGAAQIAIVTARDALPEVESLVNALREACPEAVGILQNFNKTRGNTVFSGEFRTLWGAGELEDELCGLTFSLSPRSFYQINHDQAERLYNEALSIAELTGGETALDLYCGAGTITLCLAGRVKRAIGAEIVADAVSDARKNARRNGIENAEFILADASEAAARLRAEGLRPDVVTVDPPRKGLSPEVIEAVCGMSPGRLVYVSCDPATLARDVKLFSARGYKPARVIAVDMFPRTAHVETVGLLSKLHAEHHIEVNLKLDEMDLTSSESKATYEEIKAWVLEQTGLNVSHLYIAQVKRKNGIIERENYNKPKNEDATQPQCPPDKEAAILGALKHFGMV